MGKDVIVACDFPGRQETLAFLDRFTGKKPFVKVGMELYYAEGPGMVRRSGSGAQDLLDLKLHDIPNTVKKSHGRVEPSRGRPGEPPCGRNQGDDGGGSGGIDPA